MQMNLKLLLYSNISFLHAFIVPTVCSPLLLLLAITGMGTRAETYLLSPYTAAQDDTHVLLAACK